ncbi:hypothetical protein AFUB_025990 [Aspergillus fumigatus A1163]|uniref:Uncharacterized protein n=1 Tax=Aspergillus fumigatus (strain CBS 144.89 / FGSC A1163 / CEA10) TaxID=451804 RepID=B0XS55_ASPFC|nr:hypothetical protein AFUB_025990 [Aspergillus fumigatus A1163]
MWPMWADLGLRTKAELEPQHTCNSDEIFHNDLTIRCGSAPDTEVQKKIRALTLLVQACLDAF